ncbi:MAG: glycosyltransferase family 2 protein [Cyclobacteriaceae bacterium]
MSPKTKDIAIVILNWNSFEVTRQCLSCISDLNLDYQIILVDNGSVDNSGAKLYLEFPELYYFGLKKNLGFTGGNNVALRWVIEQDYGYVLLLNNDTIFDENFVAPLLSYMDAHPNVGAIQPKIMYQNMPKIIWNAGAVYNSILGLPKTIGENKLDDGSYDLLNEVDWVTGCAMFIRTSVLKKVGLLDDIFFAYFEDVDLSLRVRKAGYQLVYFPEAKIYHLAGQSLRHTKPDSEGFLSPIFHFYNIRNQLYVMRKHLEWFNMPLAFLFVVFKDISIVIYFILRFRLKKAKMAWNGLIEGLTNSI